MTRVLIFAAGLLAGLAFSRLPHYAVFKDEPKTPEDWSPKFRRWENGLPREWGDNDRLN